MEGWQIKKSYYHFSLASDEKEVKYLAEPMASEQQALWCAGNAPCATSQVKR
jgi:hypothetical protein